MQKILKWVVKFWICAQIKLETNGFAAAAPALVIIIAIITIIKIKILIKF